MFSKCGLKQAILTSYIKVQNTQPICSSGGAGKYLSLVGIIYGYEKTDLKNIFLHDFTVVESWVELHL